MKKVFVIEDDQPIREAMAELLEMEGYATETAENGQRALEKLAATSEKPDIFLLDLMMPVMDGFEFSAAKTGIRGWSISR